MIMIPFFIGFGIGMIAAMSSFYLGRWSVRLRASRPNSGEVWEMEPMSDAELHHRRPPKEPTVFIHDASDDEMAIRKQPYLKRVMDAIRGK